MRALGTLTSQAALRRLGRKWRVSPESWLHDARMCANMRVLPRYGGHSQRFGITAVAKCCLQTEG